MELQPMCLRLEAQDGTALEEYRVRDGEIEVRQLQNATEDDREWHRVSPDELSSHVYRNTVVAQWLKYRLGRTRLLRRCIAEQSCYQTSTGTVGNYPATS
jgi:hypothetical protein